MAGHVTLVGAGPGDPDLITLRGWRALRDADVVLYDSLVDLGMLVEVDAELIFVGKRCGNHQMPQDAIEILMVGLAKQGKHVVRLKGGDPTVFGRAGEEAMALKAQGIPFDIVPGVSSSVAGPAYAGIPVTHRGVADSFAVVTAHKRFDETDFSIPTYEPRRTVVLLMGVGTTPIWSRQMLSELGYPNDTPVAFISRATSASQAVYETTLESAEDTVKTQAIGTPTIAVIGEVVRLRQALKWFDGTPARQTPTSEGLAVTE